MYEIKTEDLLKAQNNDDKAMTDIIESNSGLLWSIVKRFLGRGYEGEELYQIACIGFIKAIKRFDLNYEVKLSTYAVPYILGEIKRFLRDDGMVKVSRSLKEIATKVQEVKGELTVKLGKTPTIEEISEATGFSHEQIMQAMESFKAYGTYSLETAASTNEDSDENPLERYIGFEDVGYERIEINEIITNVLNRFSESYRFIFNIFL